MVHNNTDYCIFVQSCTWDPSTQHTIKEVSEIWKRQYIMAWNSTFAYKMHIYQKVLQHRCTLSWLWHLTMLFSLSDMGGQAIWNEICCLLSTLEKKQGTGKKPKRKKILSDNCVCSSYGILWRLMGKKLIRISWANILKHSILHLLYNMA